MIRPALLTLSLDRDYQGSMQASASGVSKPWDRIDAAVFVWLGVCALVIGWPVLSGGYATYLDNPAHLAEIDALARDGGWSDIAFAGLPIGLLHSPIAYGPLALLAQLGLPVGPLYAACLWLGAVAPSLAIYAAGRARASRAVAGAAAWLLLVQPPSVSGIASVYGGMWTHGLALGVWVLVVDVLFRAPSPRRRATLAAATALGGLLHALFVPAAALALLARAIVRRDGDERAALRFDVVAMGLGGLGTLTYLFPLAETMAATSLVPDLIVGPVDVFWLLTTPTDYTTLRTGVVLASPLPLGLGSAPMVALLVLFAWGVVQGRRDALVRTGALTVAIVLALLLTFHYADRSFLGPLPWRHLALVRVAMALGALGVSIDRLPSASALARAATPGALAAALLASLIVGALLGAPLRADVGRVDEEVMREVDELWRWLREHPDDEGRVLVADTFATGRAEPLFLSHVLARTRAETGRRTVGAYYTVVPTKALITSYSEWGFLAGFPRLRDEEELAEFARRLDVLGVGQVVTVNEEQAHRLEAIAGSARAATIGRFAVYTVGGGRSRWIQTDSSITASGARWIGPSDLLVEADAARADGAMQVSMGWHPYLVLRGAPGATLRASDDGVSLVRGLPAGYQRFTLGFEPPMWPLFASLLGWLVIFALALRGEREDALERIRDPWLAAAFVGAIVVLAVSASPLRPSGGDTVPGRYGALAVACEGTASLGGIDWLADRSALPYFAQRGSDGGLTSTFGPAPAWLGALGLLDLERGATLDDERLRARTRRAAAASVGLSAAILALLITRRRGMGLGLAGGLTAGLSFAGAATLGQDVWQQTAALPLWILALACVELAESRRWAAILAPALLAVTLYVRPGAAGIVLGLGLLWWPRARALRGVERLAAASLACVAALPFALFELTHGGALIPLGQLSANEAMAADGHAFDLSPAHLGVAIAGLLVSPARGLAVFAPIVLLGAFFAARERTMRAIGLAMLVQFLLAATFHKWWGGLGFGPRLLVEVTWLGVYAAFAFGSVRALAPLAAWTALVGTLGLARFDARAWEVPRNPDAHPEALWDVTAGPIVPLLAEPRYEEALLDAPASPFVFCGPRAATDPARER